jgi:hypothetical protein
MILIEHIEVDPARSTISFSSIPTDGTYTDLYLVLSLRNSTNTNYFTLKFNSSTSNFSQRELQGEGSGTPTSASRTDSIIRLSVATGNFTGNTFGSTKITIPNFASSNNKSFSVDAFTENNATLSYQAIIAGLWSNSSAISSIDLVSPANFDQYSSATLYGITAGSDGTTTVS